MWLLAFAGWTAREVWRYDSLLTAHQEQLQSNIAEVLERAQKETLAVASLLSKNQQIVEGLQVRDHNKLLDTTVPMLQLPYVQRVTVYRTDGAVSVQAHRPELFGRPDTLQAWLTAQLQAVSDAIPSVALLDNEMHLLHAVRVDDLNGAAGFVVVGTRVDQRFLQELEAAAGMVVKVTLGGQAEASDGSEFSVVLPQALQQAGLRVTVLQPYQALREEWRRSFWWGILGFLVAGAFMLTVAITSSRSLARTHRALQDARDSSDAASQAKSELLEREAEQRKRLDLIIRCANVGSFEWDTATQAASFSPRLLEMLGLPAEGDYGRLRVDQLVDAQDLPAVKVKFMPLLRSDGGSGVSQAAPHDFRLLRSDGRPLWVHADAISVRDAQGRALKFVASLLDISPILAAEADTRNAVARQQQLNVLRTRFVSMTSHEFRTPLAAILSSAQLLRHYESRMPAEERSTVLGSIETGVNRMTHMLDQLLNIGRAESGMTEFRPAPVDLQNLCTHFAQDVGKRYPESGSVVVTDFDIAVREGLYDERLLRHIFENLLSNAIKYSPKGGEVRFRVYRAGSRMCFEVSDQGIGIPEEDLPDLFATFHRASNVGDIVGTGLGLAIVKNSVELHRGEISVRSTLGQGTTFTVLL
jgi:PAS domain S-box-containing protein